MILNLWPPELCDDTRFLLACKENRSWDTKMSGEKKKVEPGREKFSLRYFDVFF